MLICSLVMIRISITEARARFSRYIEAVERGGTVIVCRRNVPVAEIRPLPQPLRDRRPVGIDSDWSHSHSIRTAPLATR